MTDIQEWAKAHAPKIAELDQSSKWDEADYLALILPPEEFPTGVNTGRRDSLSPALDDHLYELAKELDTHQGVERKPGTLAKHRATAIAWPRELRRIDEASYMAHYRLRGKDRFRDMEKYVKKAKREGRVLTETSLSRYRQDDKPAKPLDPLTERLEKRIGSALRSLLLGGGRADPKDGDWWHSQHVSDEEKRDAVSALQVWQRRLQ